MAWQQRDKYNNKYKKKRSFQGRSGNRYQDDDSTENQEQEDFRPRVIKPGPITSIESQKKNTKRVSVFINGKFAFGLHQDVLLQHALHSGMNLEEETIQALIAADALLRAKEAALIYLGHRARSEFEVKKKLRDKGFEASVIDQVIQRLHELSYLNDEQFATSYVKGRFKQKGYGPQRLRSELYKLGIAGPLIEQTLEEVLGNENVVERALQEAQKRLKRLRNESDLQKKRRKLFDFLMRRGHTGDVARTVIEQLDLEN